VGPAPDHQAPADDPDQRRLAGGAQAGQATATTRFVLDHPGQIRKSVERFCERHGLVDVTAHTFRHTLATRMAQAGVSMPEIAAMLGDTMATVEKNYLHLSPQFLRGALAKLKAA
jgi:integrase